MITERGAGGRLETRCSFEGRQTIEVELRKWDKWLRTQREDGKQRNRNVKQPQTQSDIRNNLGSNKGFGEKTETTERFSKQIRTGKSIEPKLWTATKS